MTQPGYEGFAALGDLLSGGVKQRAEASFYKGVRESSDAWRSLDMAREARSKAMAREALPDAIRTAGIQHPDLAAAILGMADGQPNLGTFTSGLQDLGDLELDRQQLEAMKAGNIRLANELGAVKKDRNYEPVRIEDGVMVPSGVALGDSEFQVRPLPQTDVAMELGRARTHAVRNPPPRASAPKAAPSTGGVLSDAQALAEARQAIASGASREAVRKRLKERGYSKVAAKL